MRMLRRSGSILPLCFLIALGGCASGDEPGLVGDYVGQTPPGDTPQLFAPGIVTTGLYTRDVAMTPDGSEIYFGVLLGPLQHHPGDAPRPDGVGPDPRWPTFAQDSRFFHLEPAIAPDGSRFMFLSTRVEGREPEPGEIRTWTNQDIWVMDRVDGWSEPYNLGPPSTPKRRSSSPP